MIRRPLNFGTDEPEWLLFRQPDHAQLSWQLARAWGSQFFPPLVPLEEIVSAVLTHDDGWAEWEAAPQVDATGQPIAFDEMPLGEALAIWNRSIERGERHGPLVAYAISGHFCRLLERFDSWKRRPDQEELARHFLTVERANSVRWLAEWAAQNPAADVQATANRAVGYVQLFDALSLWLLGDERRKPAEFAVPEGPVVTISPVEPGVFSANPWPFTHQTLWVSASGRLVPMRPYQTAADLHAVPSHEVELSWEFRPATGRKV